MTLTVFALHITYKHAPTKPPPQGTSMPEWRRSDRAFASHVGDRGSIPGQDRPKLLKQVGDSSTAKRSALGVSFTGPRRWPWSKGLDRVHSRCGTLKNLHCSIAMSAEHRSKFASLHRQWWRLHMSEKFRSGRKWETNDNSEHPCMFIGYRMDCDVKLAKACVVFWLHHHCLSIRCGSKTCFSPSENFLKYTELQRLRKLQRCIAIHLRG